jgi:hypothetical protein
MLLDKAKERSYSLLLDIDFFGHLSHLVEG